MGHVSWFNFVFYSIQILVMEVAYLLDVGTVWINSFPIEKGVQTRKHSGNYQINGFRVSCSVFHKIIILINIHLYR